MYEVCLPPEDSALEEGEEKSEEGDDGIKKKGLGVMVKIFQFVMKQSYICALIAMMVSDAARRWCCGVTEAGLCCICVMYLDVRKENICEFQIDHKQTVAKMTL